MDYFGHLVDELTDMVESIQDSGNAEDGITVIRALERAMRAAVQVERSRMKAIKVDEPTIARDRLVADVQMKLHRAA